MLKSLNLLTKEPLLDFVQCNKHLLSVGALAWYKIKQTELEKSFTLDIPVCTLSNDKCHPLYILFLNTPWCKLTKCVLEGSFQGS